MISFRIRETDELSMPLFQACFSNQEFCEMLYNGAHVNLRKYIEQNNTDFKYTCSLVLHDGTLSDIGFANCYKNGESYTYVGGIDPLYFNSGLGVKADIAMLSFIYDKHPLINLTTGVYKFNVRSLKLTKAVGFYRIGETESSVLFKMSKSDFYNPFVERMLRNINVEY